MKNWLIFIDYTLHRLPFQNVELSPCLGPRFFFYIYISVALSVFNDGGLQSGMRKERIRPSFVDDITGHLEN